MSIETQKIPLETCIVTYLMHSVSALYYSQGGLISKGKMQLLCFCFGLANIRAKT